MPEGRGDFSLFGYAHIVHKKRKKMDRRKFIKNVGTAGAAAFVLPRFSIASTKSPNSKLNVAFVGVGGVGGMAINGMKSENAVAFCDVDTRMSGWHKKENPK